MSLRRRSHGPADVIPHVWRCHCRPERTLTESVHCLRPVGGRFTPVSATKSRLWPLCYKTQTPVHPQYCAEGAEKKRAYSTPHPCATLPGSGPIRARRCAQPYERSYSALRLWTLSCEGRAPTSRGRPQGGERVGAETIDQPPGDGEAGVAVPLRRAARDGAAWAAHPGPDDRPRPPAASGGPVRSRAQAANGGRGRGLSGSRNHLPPLPVFVFHFPHFVAAAAPSTPQTAMFHLPHFVADIAP